MPYGKSASRFGFFGWWSRTARSAQPQDEAFAYTPRRFLNSSRGRAFWARAFLVPFGVGTQPFRARAFPAPFGLGTRLGGCCRDPYTSDYRTHFKLPLVLDPLLNLGFSWIKKD